MLILDHFCAELNNRIFIFIIEWELRKTNLTFYEIYGFCFLKTNDLIIRKRF
jgi:hypothetical protein